jgi:hypothetical protein
MSIAASAVAPQRAGNAGQASGLSRAGRTGEVAHSRPLGRDLDQRTADRARAVAVHADGERPARRLVAGEEGRHGRARPRGPASVRARQRARRSRSTSTAAGEEETNSAGPSAVSQSASCPSHRKRGDARRAPACATRLHRTRWKARVQARTSRASSSHSRAALQASHAGEVPHDRGRGCAGQPGRRRGLDSPAFSTQTVTPAPLSAIHVPPASGSRAAPGRGSGRLQRTRRLPAATGRPFVAVVAQQVAAEREGHEGHGAHGRGSIYSCAMPHVSRAIPQRSHARRPSGRRRVWSSDAPRRRRSASRGLQPEPPPPPARARGRAAGRSRIWEQERHLV